VNALAAHARGWYVFPIGSQTCKRPLAKWPKYVATPERIAQWTPPSVTGYGIDCGRSGLVVLDEDQEGALSNKHGETLPPTFTVSTGKGRHLYFLAPKGMSFRNSASVLADGVDVRAVGGYVVGPGSRHACGITYLIEDDRDPVSLPGWVADLLGAVENLSESATPAEPTYADETNEAGRAMLVGAVAAIRAARPRTRNTTLNAEAFHVAEWVKGGQIERMEALDALRDAADDCGLSSDEVENTLRSALRSAKPLPETLGFEALPDATTKGAGGSGNVIESGGAGVSIDGSAPLYVDLGALVAGGLGVPRADAGPPRPDGHQWLYYGRLNGLFGDSESAKTLAALGVLAHGLIAGGHGAFMDTDYNGPEHIVRTLLRFGVPLKALDHFRYVEPQSAQTVAAVIADLCSNMPRGVVALDSFGENIGLLGGQGASANVDESVMKTHRLTSHPLAKAGHCVLVIDHTAKNANSQLYGATGSTAKKRIVDGAYLEVKIVDEFDPASGGQSALCLKKDRTGGIRALGIKSREQVVRFKVGPLSGADSSGNGGSQSYEFLLPDLTVIPTNPNPRAATEAALTTAGVQSTDSVRAAERKVVSIFSPGERKARGITRDLIRDVFKGARLRSADTMFPETDEGLSDVEADGGNQ
jgi:hypothetical protein